MFKLLKQAFGATRKSPLLWPYGLLAMLVWVFLQPALLKSLIKLPFFMSQAGSDKLGFLLVVLLGLALLGLHVLGQVMMVQGVDARIRGSGTKLWADLWKGARQSVRPLLLHLMLGGGFVALVAALNAALYFMLEALTGGGSSAESSSPAGLSLLFFLLFAVVELWLFYLLFVVTIVLEYAHRMVVLDGEVVWPAFLKALKLYRGDRRGGFKLLLASVAVGAVGLFVSGMSLIPMALLAVPFRLFIKSESTMFVVWIVLALPFWAGLGATQTLRSALWTLSHLEGQRDAPELPPT